MILAVARMKEAFFDRPKVLAAMGIATRSVLSRFGAFVRTTAQRSMPHRKRRSAPGSPPSTHQGSLRQLIFFGFDMNANSVVIGPVPIPGTTGAPDVLEHGGTAIIKSRRRTRVVGKPGEIRLGGRTSRSTKSVVTADNRLVRVTYAPLRTAAQVARATLIQEQLYGSAVNREVTVAARPYMAPAAQKEMQNLDSMWKDSISAAA